MNPKLLLILLISSYTISTSAQTTYYINQNNPNNAPNGSRNAPFTSLNEAIESLSPGNYQLVIQGSTVTIESSLRIPSGFNLTIRPATIPNGKRHFPFYIGEGVEITATRSILKFEDFQIIDLDKTRDEASIVLHVLSGKLTLQRVLISDFQYPDRFYIFMVVEETNSPPLEDVNEEFSIEELYNSIEEEDILEDTTGLTSELNIIDSEFSNLLNVEIWVLSSKVNIQGSRFSGLRQVNLSFFTIYANIGPEITLTNVTLEDSFFAGSPEPFAATSFLNPIYSASNVTIQGLQVKNVTLSNPCSIISITNDQEDPNFPTSFKASNVTLENITEVEEDEITYGGYGMFLDILGTSYFELDNFTATNIIAHSDALLVRFESGEDKFHLGMASPTVNIKSVKLGPREDD